MWEETDLANRALTQWGLGITIPPAHHGLASEARSTGRQPNEPGPAAHEMPSYDQQSLRDKIVRLRRPTIRRVQMGVPFGATLHGPWDVRLEDSSRIWRRLGCVKSTGFF